jgi:hypothetical protein
MWSKKWYLKRNILCDVHLLNELLETDVPWDDAIVVSAGKLRKLWDSLSELRSSVCERRLERTVLRPVLLPVKTAQFTQFFPSVMKSHSKIAKFNWECIGPLIKESGTVCDSYWHGLYKQRIIHVASTRHYQPFSIKIIVVSSNIVVRFNFPQNLHLQVSKSAIT